MADGSARGFPSTIPEETLRALVTRNGGEVIDFGVLCPITPPGPPAPDGQSGLRKP